MNVTIINIGDELLIGQVVNTNATYMSRMLTQSGMTVTDIMTIGDEGDAITRTLRQALTQADAIICTGGLGPTKDDITKTILMRFFGGELKENATQLAIIQGIFAKRGYPMTPINRQQSMTPDSCITIPNPIGTAPGMWFEVKGSKQVVVSIPGVPFEALNLMQTEIVPRLKKHFHTSVILTKNIITQGIGESFLSDLIEPWELALPKTLRLAYLPQAGMTKLRLTARGEDASVLQTQIDEAVKSLYPIAGQYIVGEDCETLSELVAQLFQRLKVTLSVAESCTGGYMASQLTRQPGCSTYFKGGVVSYCNEVKHEMLGVKQTTLEEHTAVSKETVQEMVAGVRKRLISDYAIATTGIAGPDGGTAQQPVGTVWIGIATPKGVEAHLCNFGGNDRQRIIERATNEAFHLLINAVRDNQ